MRTDGLGERLQARLARGRAAAEARMGAANGASDVAIMRSLGLLPGPDGYEVPQWAAVYIGPARIGGSKSGSSGYTTRKVGDVETAVATREASLPAATTDLQDGDLVEVTAGESGAAVFRIVEATWQDQATARRVPVVQVERPVEWGV